MVTWFLRWRIIVLPKSYIPALFCSLTSALLFSFPSTSRQVHNEDVLEHSDNLHLFPEPFCTTVNTVTTIYLCKDGYIWIFPQISYVHNILVAYVQRHVLYDWWNILRAVTVSVETTEWLREWSYLISLVWDPALDSEPLLFNLVGEGQSAELRQSILCVTIVPAKSYEQNILRSSTKWIFFWAEYIGANTKEWRNSHMREVNRTLWDW